MIVLGLLLGIVGTDVNSGVERFDFGIPELSDGIGVVVVAMGLFGFAEIILNLESTEKRELIKTRLKGMWLSRSDSSREAAPAVLRGTALGSMLGVLPGGGAMLSSFASYSIEKKLAKDPSQFGKGAIQGVAGPESANNAGAQTSFIPLLTLGIPENAVMAMMVGAMTIHNIQPGPQVMTSNPQLFWGLIASMWIGNLMLVVLNLPLIGIWIKLLTVPYRMLYPAILLFCAIGVYTVNNTSFDVMQTAFFGAARRAVRQARMRARAAAARLRARSDDGGEPAPRAAAVARRSDRYSPRGRSPRACSPRRSCSCWSSRCRTSAASARKRSRKREPAAMTLPSGLNAVCTVIPTNRLRPSLIRWTGPFPTPRAASRSARPTSSPRRNRSPRRPASRCSRAAATPSMPRSRPRSR